MSLLLNIVHEALLDQNRELLALALATLFLQNACKIGTDCLLRSF